MQRSIPFTNLTSTDRTMYAYADERLVCDICEERVFLIYIICINCRNGILVLFPYKCIDWRNPIITWRCNIGGVINWGCILGAKFLVDILNMRSIWSHKLRLHKHKLKFPERIMKSLQVIYRWCFVYE